jgi:hypothetical protein
MPSLLSGLRRGSLAVGCDRLNELLIVIGASR